MRKKAESKNNGPKKRGEVLGRIFKIVVTDNTFLQVWIIGNLNYLHQ